MTILVVGASGATGSKLVDQLLLLEHKVKIVVRSTANLPEHWKSSNNLEIITASILDIQAQELREIVADCDAVASCLGHNLTFKGIYGQPRKLVTDTAKNICKAIQENKPEKPVKYVLMNTTGNRNRDLNEPLPFKNRIVIALLRLLLPPHVDNEKAADFLRTEIGQDNKFIQWSTIRPDNLVDENEVTPYEIHGSPIRNPIFSSGKTSRINVGHFMASLIDDQKLWENWKGQMPVIYNSETT